MRSKSLFSTLITAWVAVPSVILFLFASSASAQNKAADYTFLVASGLLCDPNVSAACPAVAKSANGDSYQLSGAGTFNAQSKSVTAAGTYTHQSSNGTVLETGVWTATQLIGFNSYGTAPGALMVGGRTVGAPPFDLKPTPGRPPSGPNRLPKSFGPVPTGGLAVFRVQLLPTSGLAKTSVLQVNCALGDVPRERSVEGIRISLEKNDTEYSDEVSGRVMFLAMHPEVSRTCENV